MEFRRQLSWDLGFRVLGFGVWGLGFRATQGYSAHTVDDINPALPEGP